MPLVPCLGFVGLAFAAIGFADLHCSASHHPGCVLIRRESNSLASALETGPLPPARTIASSGNR